MASRKSPKAKRGMAEIAVPKRTKHQKMLDQMHDALYTLGNKINPPMPMDKAAGENLLPKPLQPGQPPNLVSEAKNHVATLHKAFLQSVMGNKKNEKKP